MRLHFSRPVPQNKLFWSFSAGAGISMLVSSSISNMFAALQLPSLPKTTTAHSLLSPPEKLDHRRDHHHHKAASLFPDSCQASGISAFDKIYETGVWQAKIQPISAFYNNATLPAKTRRSASGPGSDLGYNTQISLKILQEVIREHAIETMIDIPCGDVNWIFDSWETDGALKLYVGLDIVRAVITANQERLAHHSNKVFQVWDGAKCPMPRLVFDQGGGDQQPVDLIQVRDVIMHLPLDHALNLLCNVLTSKARILVATTFPTGRNENIEEGTWYQNDLTARPFDFPSDVPCQQTHPNHAGDLTCIYDLTKPWVEEWIKAKNCPVVSD